MMKLFKLEESCNKLIFVCFKQLYWKSCDTLKFYHNSFQQSWANKVILSCILINK